MPLVHKRNTIVKGGATDRRPGLSVLILAVFFLTLLAVPQAGWPARLAGEDQAVTTAPAPAPQKAAAAPASQKAAAVQAASQPALPAASPAPAAAQGSAAGSSDSSDRTIRRLPPRPQGALPPPPTAPASRAASAQNEQARPLPPPPVNAPQPVIPKSMDTPQTEKAEVPPPPPASPSAVPARQPASAQSGRYVTIDFDNVDISVFIKFVSELTGRNFVIDDKVKAKVTVISPKKIAVEEVYKVFESVLEIYGFATVDTGEVTKVILAQDARGKNLELLLKPESSDPEDKIVTQILSLQHASPDEMKKVLDPLISKTSIILSYPPTGMLIITDVLSNVKRLQNIVTALDVDGVGEMISYVPLKSASATDMVKSLTAMFQPQAGRGLLAPIRIVADDRTNALIISATENDTARIRQLLNLMDKEIPKGGGAIRVYYLQNAKAEDLMKVLTGLPSQTRPAAGVPAATGAAAATSGAAAVLSKNVQIVADKSTNALIITADTADYLVLEDVIRKLDITRPMVYLEALIMEVNADKSFGVGVEWSAVRDVGATGIGNEGSRNVAIAGFRGSSIIPQINTTTGSFSLPGGFSLGVVGAGINITVGGQNLFFPNVGAVLQAFKNDTDIRILSTPQLLTLDNEEAEITVGSNVPYVTRQDSGVVGSTNNFSSYEYKDVGVTLKVTPQINNDGFIRMKLDQSVTKLVSQSAALSTGSTASLVLAPTTLKRTAKTTVSVKSGETVVIGGMIQDDSTEGTSKVPLLGDIPLLGWLFKTKNTTSTRTNLFIFVTPRIIENPDEAGKIQEEKMDHLRAVQEGTIKNTPARKKEIPETKEGAAEPSALKE